jgi:putative membrane protein insertion efficiency factor
MKDLALVLIGLYQQTISQVIPSSCRFTPTCSQYTYEAVSRFGFAKGVWLGMRRLARCHPLHYSGYDPVPKQQLSGSPKRMSSVLRYKKMLLSKILFLMALLVAGMTFSGCVGFGGMPLGWSGVVTADSAMFFGSMNGKLVTLDLSGNLLWQTPLEGSASSGGFGCAPGSTSVAIYGVPAVSGDLVYVGAYNGKLYAVSSSTGLSKDVYLDESNPQPIVGGPVVAQGKIYIASSDGKLYALDATSLDKEWEFLTGDKIWSTPAMVDDTLFIGSFDKKLYAINAADGSQKWESLVQGAIVSTPLVYNDTVYVGSFDRYFYAVDATNG